MCELRYLLMQVNKRPREFRKKKNKKTLGYKSAVNGNFISSYLKTALAH